VLGTDAAHKLSSEPWANGSMVTTKILGQLREVVIMSCGQPLGKIADSFYLSDARRFAATRQSSHSPMLLFSFRFFLHEYFFGAGHL